MSYPSGIEHILKAHVFMQLLKLTRNGKEFAVNQTLGGLLADPEKTTSEFLLFTTWSFAYREMEHFVLSVVVSGFP